MSALPPVGARSIRDTLYESLPPTGKDAQGKLALWALANGASNAELEEVLADSRVQFELKQTPVDGVGLSQAVGRVYPDSGARIRDAMFQPVEKLQFLMLFR